MEKYTLIYENGRKIGLENQVGVVEEVLRKECPCIRGEGSLIWKRIFLH